MNGRPNNTEAAPYYFTYINLVPDEDVVTSMANQLGESLHFFAAISEERSLYQYAPLKWTIREVLSHITDAERVFAFRALWFARGFATPLPSFDQDVAVSAARANAVSWIEHIEDFRRVRLSTVSLFKNMDSEAWTRSGTASDNSFTVRSLAYIIAGHLNHHVAVLRERYL